MGFEEKMILLIASLLILMVGGVCFIKVQDQKHELSMAKLGYVQDENYNWVKP